MLPMSDQAIIQQNKLRRLREEMMEVSMTRKHICRDLLKQRQAFLEMMIELIRSMTQQN
jgi:hypothetical protein